LVQAIAILLIAGSLGAFIAILRPRPTAVVVIRGGKPAVIKGRVSRDFMEACERLCTETEVRAGRISVYVNRTRALLKFSPQIPENWHQRLRNVWNLPR
jgi:hypothetical protein